MGTLGDNLLKLTEFPFSYSLISLLTLISLGEGLLDQPPERLAPLLILMGFVATTLSMTDPIGVLLKESLYGFKGRVRFGIFLGTAYVSSRSLSRRLSRFSSAAVTYSHPNRYDWTRLSAEEKKEYLNALVIEMEDMPIFGSNALLSAFSSSIIKPTVIICLSPNFFNIFSSRHFRDFFYRNIHSSERAFLSFQEVLDMEETLQIFGTILSLKKASLGTPWMVREIDKITGMIYFLIVVAILISTFILDHFFGTSFSDKFLVIFQGSEQARDSIFSFSVIVFSAVSYKLIKRLNELQSKAFTTFVFLLEREAIKIEGTSKEKDIFDKSLQEIERYLTNGDWTLAELLVHRVMKEYDDFIRREWIEKEKITPDEAKDVEGEPSAEEIKNVGNKKVNYQDLGIY